MNDWNSYLVIKRDGPRWQWGDPEKMQDDFLRRVDNFLKTEKLEVMVTYGTQGKHVENSEHAKGHAADTMYPQILRRDLPDIYYAALRYDFTGVGIYSEWKLSANGSPLGGLHLQWVPEQAGQRRRLWLWGPNGEEPLKWARVKELFR